MFGSDWTELLWAGSADTNCSSRKKPGRIDPVTSNQNRTGTGQKTAKPNFPHQTLDFYFHHFIAFLPPEPGGPLEPSSSVRNQNQVHLSDR